MTDLRAPLRKLQDRLGALSGLLRVEEKRHRLSELESEMKSPEFWKDKEHAASVSKEGEELRREIDSCERLDREVGELIGLAEELSAHPDEAMAVEIGRRLEDIGDEVKRLEFISLFDGRHDDKNAIVSIYAGSGGTEAQDWAAMLLRMLLRYAEKKGWKTEILDESRGAEAGIKSATVRVAGRWAYGRLKSEHGTHRLVRISPFDAEKMRHTSFAGIEVVPELESSAAQIDPKDLRIDTFQASGHGGQSVNTTYSAVRIVHIPTGITVQCQNERSQQQNKDVAMRVLLSKLQQIQEEKEDAERREIRGEHVGASWGTQIRSYVLHPYKLVKDVRTKHESADPEAALGGDLDEFVEAYLKWRKAGQSL